MGSVCETTLGQRSRVDTARSFAKSPRRRWDQTELCDIGQVLRMQTELSRGGSRPRAGLSRRVVGWCRCGVRETTERVPQFSSPTRRSSLSAVIAVVVIIVEIVIGIACVNLVVLFRSVSAACPARVPFQSSTQHATDLEARSLYVRYRTITIGTMTTTIEFVSHV
ncbi:hypothetical protein G5I_12891 [Acromyrmex echinatior]|uniref:Uncharacterized protein n=1 Tax=Acromyrmex echinatior TaxID=103372 RepID=F4X3E5_ACREC|nr:hypothetical protein G5I_12891 [Acromyrmex echinatior]